jgi:hypothetical protein
MKPKLKPPGTKRLKVRCDVLLSTSAFKFNLRRYIKLMRKQQQEQSTLSTAGAYTRSLFSSTSAVSDTQKHPTHRKHPLTPPYTGYTIPTRTPYPIKSAQVELRSEQM